MPDFPLTAGSGEPCTGLSESFLGLTRRVNLSGEFGAPSLFLWPSYDPLFVINKSKMSDFIFRIVNEKEPQSSM
jgi:hypothetical protein